MKSDVGDTWGGDGAETKWEGDGPMKDLAIYCADIGSIRNSNFGWAGMLGEQQCEGTEIGVLVQDLRDKLVTGVKVALGFECPLWVPVPDDPSALTGGRAVDGNRPWSAAAGASALAAGLTETVWILSKLHRGLTKRGVSSPRVHLDWDEFAGSDEGLFLWEAFVAGKAKPEFRGTEGSHIADALAACREFRGRLPQPAEGCTSEPSHAARSLIGAAVLWSGWSTDLGLLRAKCLVIKPAEPTA